MFYIFSLAILDKNNFVSIVRRPNSFLVEKVTGCP